MAVRPTLVFLTALSFLCFPRAFAQSRFDLPKLAKNSLAANAPTYGAGGEQTPLTLGDYPDISVSLSGDTNIAPSVAPANTTSINVATNSNFKGTFAASPATGIVTVTDAHPAGIYLVAVNGFGPGGTTTKTFTLTVTSVPCPANFFTNAPDVKAYSFPVSIAIGDFNGDGHQDLAVANFLGKTVSIRLGDGSGGFSGTTEVSVPNYAWSVAVGDFNGDGKQDLAAGTLGAGAISNTVSIRLGDGLGGFAGTTEVDVSPEPASVAIGDFNGDGKQDLAVACNSGVVSIRLGNGSGGFSGTTTVPVGTGFEWLALGDFNGDGKQDLAVANDADNNVSIRLGDGLGGFTSPATPEISVGTTPEKIAVGDFNNDGKQDFAVVNFDDDTVSIRLGDGSGGFFSPAIPDVSVGLEPSSAAIGDFNGDGNQDLVAGNANDTTISIRLGDGSGGFSSPTVPEVSVGSSPFSIAVGDFNGDGRQDLAVANESDTTVSIRLGGCVPISPPCPGTIFSETFDALAAPTLPAGWVATNAAGAGPLWLVSTTAPDTAPNSAFVDDPGGISDKRLDTPDITINTDSALVSFRNSFDLESTFDGGVLEVSSPNINGGAFTDIIDPAVGGSFVSGGYNATISSAFGNRIAGRRAWSGSSCGYFCSVANLGPVVNGQTIKLRFRMGSDLTGSGHGWRVDTIQVLESGSVCGPCVPLTQGPAKLLNMSARAWVGTGPEVLIGGFIITGNAPKRLALRGIGPSLISSGIVDGLGDPTLELRDGNGNIVLSNDDWKDTQQAQIEALELAPTHNSESVMVLTLPPCASYTVTLAGRNGGTGVGLLEIYDLDFAAQSELANFSARGPVQTASHVMIGGFILGGNNSNTAVALRGIGPSLPLSLSPLLANPALELHGVITIANDNWLGNAQAAAEFPSRGLSLPYPAESGIFTSLPPGAFTTILAGTNGGIGLGLIELYNVH